MRLPNPRVGLPIVLGALAGGVVGWFVTTASCAPGSCPVAAGVIATLAALVAGAGVGVVVVLAMRSFAEWHEHDEREVLVESDDETGVAP